MDAARLEEILRELEAEARQDERRLWLSPEARLLGTRAGLYALAGDLVRAAEARKCLFVGSEELFAGRLNSVGALELLEKSAELEKQAARRERSVLWLGRLSVLAAAVLGILFLYFFFRWYVTTL